MCDVSELIYEAEQRLKAGTFDKIDLHRFAVRCMDIGKDAAPYCRESRGQMASVIVETNQRETTAHRKREQSSS